MKEVLRKDPENIIERPQKKEDRLEKLLEHLLENMGWFDMGDILYSKRFRKQVWDIVQWMISHDYVHDDNYKTHDDVDNISMLRKWMSRLANCQKRLSAYEQEYDTSWLSICYPLKRKYVSCDMPQLAYRYGLLQSHVQRELGLLICRMPRFKASSDDMNEDSDDSSRALVDELLSVRHLVDQTGEPIKPNFRGKYVLVCCVNAPVLFDSNGFQSLLNLCNELCSERGDIKMVMVARMNILAHTKEVFDHLFSGFPSSCVAVPYEDWEQRDHICKLLKCGAHEMHRCAVYDTNGLFLKSFCIDGYMGTGFPYGAEAFPFTEELLKKTDTERKQLREDSLEKLLRPYESSPDVVVYEVNHAQKDLPPNRISELMKNKYVGLYVCCEGSLIPLLHRLYEQCMLKHQEFEIVVLYLPLLSRIDPGIFKERMDGLLQTHKICGWWCLPFNNSVSLRFWDLTSDYDIGDMRFQEEWEDKLIIVGSGGKILDMYGGHVIKVHGIDVFPFTRAAIVEKRMREVRDVRLESLLGGQLFRGNDPADVISADTLLSSKKKIIIYMGRVLNQHKFKRMLYDFHGLVSQYEEMKKNVEFEVVFVEYLQQGEIPEVDASKFFAMPWYIHCPRDRTHAPLAQMLKQLVNVESLVGFGEDGHICSVKLLYPPHTPQLCLDETLFDDLYHLFQFDEYSDI